MLEKTLKIIGCLLFVGCAVPAYTSFHGIKGFDDTNMEVSSKEALEEVVELVLRKTGKKGTQKLYGYKIHFVNKWIRVPKYNSNEYALADGLTNPFDRVMVVSVFQDCLADSGLPHELAHVLHDSEIPDWWHEDKEYWKWVKNTLEPEAISELCGADHVHKTIPPDYVPPRG